MEKWAAKIIWRFNQKFVVELEVEPKNTERAQFSWVPYSFFLALVASSSVTQRYYSLKITQTTDLMRISFLNFSQIGQLISASFTFDFSGFCAITYWFLFSTTRQQCCFVVSTVRKGLSFLHKQFCYSLMYVETSLRLKVRFLLYYKTCLWLLFKLY